MPKQKTVYFCTECGHETSGWMGKCPGCNAWNTITEEKIQTGGKKDFFAMSQNDKPLSLSEIDLTEDTRQETGIKELDRVLGGGFVKGSLVLVGGDPGIGKSTLLMQVCAGFGSPGHVLYVSGEESPAQIKGRSERLGVSSGGLKIYSKTSFSEVANTIEKTKPALVIVDSIQTMYTDEISSAPGSVSQVREVAYGFLRIAKNTATTVVLIGHVTKEGAIAGPRVLEHMVDTVLYFEGEKSGTYRILRAVKNRFGATDEIGLFEMTGKGLLDVKNASAAMLEGRPENVPGTVVTSCMEGTRPILMEIQALVTECAYSAPQRMTQGLDRNRVTMLLAVLDKCLTLGLSGSDVFINVVGGMKSVGTSPDLALLAAVISCTEAKPLKSGLVVFGEVGLTGETRPVFDVERRLTEALRMGFDSCVLPGGCKKVADKIPGLSGIDLMYVDRLGEMIDILF